MHENENNCDENENETIKIIWSPDYVGLENLTSLVVRT